MSVVVVVVVIKWSARTVPEFEQAHELYIL